MSRKKQHPLIEAMNLYDRLSSEHQLLLLAYAKNRAVKPAKGVKPVANETVKKGAICVVCGNEQDHPDHDTAYLSSHPFASPAAAVKRVKKKSSPSIAPDSSTANIQTETAIATSAGE